MCEHCKVPRKSYCAKDGRLLMWHVRLDLLNNTDQIKNKISSSGVAYSEYSPMVQYSTQDNCNCYQDLFYIILFL